MSAAFGKEPRHVSVVDAFENEGRDGGDHRHCDIERPSGRRSMRESTKRQWQRIRLRLRERRLHRQTKLPEEEKDLAEVDRKFSSYPLVISMIRGHRARYGALNVDGTKQTDYVKSTDGWFNSIFVWEERAWDRIFAPWVIVTLNAVLCTLLDHFFPHWGLHQSPEDVSDWQAFYGVVLNIALAFLLVFRLNRAATRYWDARGHFGLLIVLSRQLASSLVWHARHAPDLRDEALSWLSSYAVAVMHFLRHETKLPRVELCGILSARRIAELQAVDHPPLYVAQEVRRVLVQIFGGDSTTPSTPASVAILHTSVLQRMEDLLDRLLLEAGSLEKILTTPLPMVFVSHLRTFLVLFLLSLPWVWVPLWHFTTIPLVSLTAVALLGLEGAAQETEIPFSKDRSNHLALNTFCAVILNDLEQIVTQAAEDEMRSGSSDIRTEVAGGGSDDDDE